MLMLSSLLQCVRCLLPHQIRLRALQPCRPAPHHQDRAIQPGSAFVVATRSFGTALQFYRACGLRQGGSSSALAIRRMELAGARVTASSSSSDCSLALVASATGTRAIHPSTCRNSQQTRHPYLALMMRSKTTASQLTEKRGLAAQATHRQRAHGASSRDQESELTRAT